MATTPISFAVDDEDLPLLKQLVDGFAGGNRSEFLRLVMKDYKKKLRMQQMNELQQEMLAERGGRTYTTEETLATIERHRVD